MRGFGHVEITSLDLPDELQFVATRQNGSLEWAIETVVLVFFFGFAWQQDSLSLLIFGIIGFVAIVADWVHGHTILLRVTADEVFASGNLGRILITEERVSASYVTSMGYEDGGENESCGLYVKHGWSRTCILPAVDKKQAQIIAEAICAKFPQFDKADNSPASLLFGDDSGVTALGFGGPKK